MKTPVGLLTPLKVFLIMLPPILAARQKWNRLHSKCAWIGCLALVLLGTGSLQAQRDIGPPAAPVNSDDYYFLREKYLAQLKAAEKERERRDDRGRRADDQLEQAFKHWDEYWQNHLDARSRSRGKLIDMSLPLRAYYEAATQRERKAGPSISLTPIVCPSAGLGNWTSRGPSLFPAPIMGKVTSAYADPFHPNTFYAGGAGGGLFKTVNSGTSWTNLTDGSHFPSLGITSIAVDPTTPTTIYISTANGSPGGGNLGAMGGPYGFGILKSTNGGTTWQEIFVLAPFNNQANFNIGEGSFVSKIMLHPQNPNVIFALAQHYVFRSLDAGVSWQKVMEIFIPSVNNDGCAYRLVDIDVINGASGVSDSSIIVSTVRTAWLGLANSPCGTAKSFLSVAGGAALTWTEVTDPNGLNLLGGDPTDRIAAAVQPGNSTEIFVAYQKLTSCCSGNLVVKKYDINTGTTSMVGTITANGVFQLGGGLWNLEFEFSKIDPNTAYFAGTTIYRANMASPFVGANPVQISSYWATSGTGTPVAQTHADVRHMVVTMSGSSDVVVAGTDGGIHKAVLNPTPAITYNPTTANWDDLTGPGLALNEFFDVNISQSNPGVIVAGAQDNGTFKDNNGIWEQSFNYDGWRGTINQATGQYFGITNAGAIRGMATTPGQFVNINAPAISGGPVISDPNNPAIIYGGGASLYKSINFGTSWTTLPSPSGSTSIRAIEVAPSDSNWIYVSREGPTWNPANLSNRLFRSINAGNTWTDIGVNLVSLPGTPLAWASVTDIAVDPDNANRIWISINGYWSTTNTSLNGVERVLYSGDGGNTWSDFTYNLLAFPVSSLLYRNGTNDEIYAGTDVGVFRYNASLQLWECFNNMLPVVPVTRMEINYCKNKIVCSTWGRGIYESDIPALPSDIVNTSVTWSGVRHRSNDLTIASGATLTLTGTLNMGRNARIIVQRGATFDVNGGKITNCCGDLWYGIEVWGTTSAAQNLAGAQGKFIARNNAIIENAVTAVTTGKDVNTLPDPNYAGGIVQAYKAKFFNNRISAKLASYHWMSGVNEVNNQSYFKDSTFETNRLLNDATLQPFVHILLDDVKGIDVLGCKFNNTTSTTVFGVNNRGDGVVIWDAHNTKVDDLRSGINTLLAPSAFNGLTYGVRAAFTAGANKKVTISSNDFTNVQRGVQINYSIGSSVDGNSFTALPNALTTNFTNATWGVRMSNATGLEVRANVVTGASTSYQNNYGVIIENGGNSATNFVRANTLKNLYTGIQVLGSNGAGANGVQFRCNVFQSTMSYQLAVAPAATLANQGSVCSQGSTADNTFFGQALPAGSQINSPTTVFTYFASGTVPTNIAGPVIVSNCSSTAIDECNPNP